MKKKVIFENTETIVDTNTGEVQQITSYKTNILEREPDFVKLYISDIMRLNNLPNSTEKVLNIFLSHMSYKNIIAAYAPIKKMICKDLNININTLNKAIDDLYKAGVLIRLDRGMYMVDPNLFGKGKWEDIKGLRMVIEYNPQTGKRTISGERVDQLKLNF